MFFRRRKIDLPMILRNLRLIKVTKDGYPITDGNDPPDKRNFIHMVSLPVFEFELYFADSYRMYGIEHVRARDNRQAKRKIKRMYPNVIKFDWGNDYGLE
jgi:hypothetical protein